MRELKEQIAEFLYEKNCIALMPPAWEVRADTLKDQYRLVAAEILALVAAGLAEGEKGLGGVQQHTESSCRSSWPNRSSQH